VWWCGVHLPLQWHAHSVHGCYLITKKREASEGTQTPLEVLAHDLATSYSRLAMWVNILFSRRTTIRLPSALMKEAGTTFTTQTQHTTHTTHHTSHTTHHTPHTTHHTPHHTSHITHHTSHITHITIQ
jgi:hypothetical protein